MSVPLPPEILLLIFLEIQRAHYWSGSEKEPPCCAVSQVCRQWREVALGTSELWATIPIACLPWTNDCLLRSRESCVDVNVRWITPDDHVKRQSLLLVYSDLPRVSKLVFSTDTNYYEYRELLAEVFAGLSLRPAPKLRELDISIPDEIDYDRAPIIFPKSFFASQKLPSLERLAIRSCELTISWSNTFLTSSLRELELNDALAWNTVDEMVQFFELVPHLESFALENLSTRSCIFDTSLSSRYPRKGTPLSRLRNFDISTRYLDTIVIFAYLSIPIDASVSIHITEGDEVLEGEAEGDGLLETIGVGILAFREHFAPAAAAGRGYTSLRIQSDGIYVPCYDHCLLHGSSNSTTTQYSGGESVRLRLPFGIPRHRRHRALVRSAYGMLLQQPVFEMSTTICISGILLSEAWSCFDKWTAVETLLIDKFIKHALSGFVAAMHRQGFRLFPALRHLQIVSATIVEPDEPQDDSSGLAYFSVDGEGLRGTNAREFVAAMTKLAGYERFERLTLTNCAVSAQALRATKELLGPERVVEGDTESPADRLERREYLQNRKFDWEDLDTWHGRILSDTD